jgi:ArsR family transcriptional regulator
MGAMVKARRDGKWMHYQVIEPKNKKAKEVFAGIMEMLSEDKEMQSDRRKGL